MNYKLRTTNYKNHRRGMALLAVLFIVFAITVISMGLLYRSDMALACGQNLCLRNQSDYLAWAGLEHARAYIQSYGSTALDPNEASVSEIRLFGDDSEFYSNFHYTVEFGSRTPAESDPNKYTYNNVVCEAWYGSASDPQAYSELHADIRYSADDPNGTAVFSSIRRQ